MENAFGHGLRGIYCDYPAMKQFDIRSFCVGTDTCSFAEESESYTWKEEIDSMRLEVEFVGIKECSKFQKVWKAACSS